MTTLPNTSTLRNALLITSIFLLSPLASFAQTEKGTYALLLHNFSPSGIKIDGLPMNLFPQNSGLGFSFGSHKTKLSGDVPDVKEKNLMFGLSLSGQYFIWDNFSFGISGNYYTGTTTYKQSEKADEKYATSMLLGGAELRYYITGSRHINYWIKASPALGTINSTYNSKEVHVPKRLYQFSGGIGASYFPSSSFSIDLGITYNVFTVRNRGGYSELSRKEYIDNVGLDIGFSIFF